LNAAYSRAGAVLLGYVAAVVLGVIAVSVRIALTLGPESTASSGMYAFGDAILFLLVFGTISLLPTGLAMMYLRAWPPFWPALAICCAAMASTAISALILLIATRSLDTSTTLGMLGSVSVLRVFPAPFFALSYALAAAFSPHRASRWVLAGSAIAEIALCIGAGLTWFASWLR